MSLPKRLNEAEELPRRFDVIEELSNGYNTADEICKVFQGGSMQLRSSNRSAAVDDLPKRFNAAGGPLNKCDAVEDPAINPNLLTSLQKGSMKLRSFQRGSMQIRSSNG